MIQLDTNFVIATLEPTTAEARATRRWLNAGRRLGVSAPAWAEFLCGPLSATDRLTAAQLLGSPVPFGVRDAELAAELFNVGGRRRRTLVDCMIAAVAIVHGADLATANTADFARFAVRGLRLTAP